MIATPDIEVTRTSRSAIAIGVFRIVVALLFLIHGTAKVFGYPGGSALPAGSWPAWWAGVLELVLGAMIAIGLYARSAAFIASGTMAVAYFWMHFPRGFWPLANGGEPAVLYCFIFLLIVFIGPGAFAVSRRF
ncbi:DoxX family protein [Mycobacterium sp. smrl_JER01]|uniref:DoxX family protein n=1 Tax=Mycobacterium sp. smrl_JER01 TaxID=3402633 RepID=UPI003ABE5226